MTIPPDAIPRIISAIMVSRRVKALVCIPRFLDFFVYRAITHSFFTKKGFVSQKKTKARNHLYKISRRMTMPFADYVPQNFLRSRPLFSYMTSSRMYTQDALLKAEEHLPLTRRTSSDQVTSMLQRRWLLGKQFLRFQGQFDQD